MILVVPLPDSVLSKMKDFCFLMRVLSLLKYSFPAVSCTFETSSGEISLAISSALRNG